MKIIFIRHGETPENEKKITQGWMDNDLSELGLVQARKIAENLKNENISFIYSSDLKRASNTAKEILKLQKSSKLILDKSLREQNKGIYEGQPVGTSQKDMDKLGIPWHEFKPEGGESHLEVLDRMSKFYESIKQKHKNETIAIVTHGGPLSLILSYINKEKLEDHKKYHNKNASITIIEFDDKENPIIKELNYTKHLE
jgi:broad specificity phosphatase PhoE